MAEQQMMQFACHHRAEIRQGVVLHAHPFAVGTGHDINRRRLFGIGANQLGFFTAHDVVVIFTFDTDARNNPGPVR
ncbi:hypothetical protein D3C78_1167670 [compost metagenome]